MAPTYATIGGVQRELSAIPAVVGGVQRDLDFLYGTVDAVAREIFSAVKYTWNVYRIDATIDEVESTSAIVSSTFSGTFYYNDATSPLFSCLNANGYIPTLNTVAATAFYTDKLANDYANVFKTGRWVSHLEKKYGGGLYPAFRIKSVGSYNETAGYIFVYYDAVAVNCAGSYVETVTSSDPSAYPDNGKQGSRWYVKI